MRSRRVARAAPALALVCALACLDASRGDPDAEFSVGAGGSDPESDPEFPSRDPPQRAPLPSFPTEADTAFAAWLKAKEGAFTNAGVWSYVETERLGDGSIVTENNRGVFAKDLAVENGDVVFEISLDAALMVPSDHAGSILNKVVLQVDPEWALAFLLVRESNLGPSSPYAPFLKMVLGDDDEEYAEDSGRDAENDSKENSSEDRYRATCLTKDAVRALRGTYAGAYHDAMVRKDRETFVRVLAMTVGKFPAAFPEKTFGDFNRVANALRTVRAKGVRFPIAIGDTDTGNTVRISTAAALVPVAHALPHDPRGAEPCVAVAFDEGFKKNSQPRLLVRVAAAEPGEELRCHRGLAVPVSETGEVLSSSSERQRGVLLSEGGGFQTGQRDSKGFRFFSATATGIMTDAESMFRFASVGVGRNARDAVALTLADPTYSDGDGDDESESFASRASLLKRCGPTSRRVMTRDGPSEELWCAVRVATADDAEAVKLAKKLAEKDALDEASRGDASAAAAMLRKKVSDAAEARALAALLETTAAILDGYPTSDARDEALLRRSESFREEKDEDEDEEDDDDENHEMDFLADDVLEAVRCRLREKRLLLDALNGLQRLSSVTLPKNMRIEVVAGDKESLGGDEEMSPYEQTVSAADAGKSPPGGFEVKKATYEREL